jgi:hypothetical protein
VDHALPVRGRQCRRKRAQQANETLVLTNGAAAVPAEGEQLDQSMLRLVLRRIGCDPGAGGLQGAGEVVAAQAFLDPVAAVEPVSAGEMKPLTIDPALPGPCVHQVDGVEERSTVEPGGIMSISPFDRDRELAGVAAQGRTGDQFVAADVHPAIVAQRLSQSVERLAECVACVAGIALGPEGGEQRIAADAPRHREVDEQGEPRPMLLQAGQLAPIREDAQTPGTLQSDIHERAAARATLELRQSRERWSGHRRRRQARFPAWSGRPRVSYATVTPAA